MITQRPGGVGQEEMKGRGGGRRGGKERKGKKGGGRVGGGKREDERGQLQEINWVFDSDCASTQVTR